MVIACIDVLGERSCNYWLEIWLWLASRANTLNPSSADDRVDVRGSPLMMTRLSVIDWGPLPIMSALHHVRFA